MATGYPQMTKALNATKRRIVFSCSWPAYLNPKVRCGLKERKEWMMEEGKGTNNEWREEGIRRNMRRNKRKGMREGMNKQTNEGKKGWMNKDGREGRNAQGNKQKEVMNENNEGKKEGGEEGEEERNNKNKERKKDNHWIRQINVGNRRKAWRNEGRHSGSKEDE